MKKLSMVLLATGLVLGACGGKKSDKNEPPPATGSGSGSAEPAPPPTPTPETTGSGSGSAEPVADVDIPTEVDFESQATEEITDKTVDAKVKQLEADLAP